MKKVLSLVLVLTLVLGSFSFAFAAAPSDVVGTEYEEAVDRLIQLGVLTGYTDGSFKPENQINRAEFAAAVVRVKGLDSAAQASKGATAFKDVPAGHWAAGYVNIATKAGLVKGMGDGTFAPNDPVTYEQAVTMVMRALGYEPAAEARGGYPYGYLIVANQEGLLDRVKGTQGLAAPRGLVAQLLDNALNIPQMIQVGFGTQTKWVKSGTEETDPVYLLTELGYKNSIDRVTKYDASRKLVTVGKKVLEVKDGFDFEGVKGLRVIAWYDNYDNLVLLSKLDTPKFDAVEPTKTGLYLIGEEKSYALAKDKDGKVDVTLTLDGKSVDFDEFEADYAKVVLDKYGDIAWAEGFTFDGNIVVEKVDGNVIESFGYEELSLKGYTLVKDGKDLAVADLEENDIVFYNNAAGIKFAVVHNNAIEGKIGKIYSSPASFELDGEKYTIGAAKYLDGKVLGNLDANTVNSIKTEQEEVTAYVDFYGELVLLVGTKAASAPASVALVVDSVQYQNRGTNYYTLDTLNAEGKIVNYDLSEKEVTAIVRTALGKAANYSLDVSDWQGLVGVTNVVSGPRTSAQKIVQLTINASGKVTGIAQLTEVVVSGTHLTSASYINNVARLQDSAVVFRIDGETNPAYYSVTTWDKAGDEFTQLLTGTAYVNSLNRVVAIKALTTNAQLATTTYTGLVTDVRVLRGGLKADVTMEIKGEEKVITVPTSIATYGKLVEDAIVQVKVVNKTGEISEVITPFKQNAVVKSTTPGSRIIETVANGTFYLENDGVIYQNKSFATLRFADLKKDDVIDLYRIADGSSYVNYVVKGVTSGPSIVPTAGKVTYINSDSSVIEIDGKGINVVGDAQTLIQALKTQFDGAKIAFSTNSNGEIYRISAIDATNFNVNAATMPITGITFSGNVNVSANTVASNVTVNGNLTVSGAADLTATNWHVLGTTTVTSTGTVSFNSELDGNVSVSNGTVGFTNVEFGGNVAVSGGTVTITNGSVAGNIAQTAGTVNLAGKLTVDGNVTGTVGLTGLDAANKTAIENKQAAGAVSEATEAVVEAEDLAALNAALKADLTVPSKRLALQEAINAVQDLYNDAFALVDALPGDVSPATTKADLLDRLDDVQDAIDAAQGQHDVSEKAAGVALTLTATGGVGTEVKPSVGAGFTIAVKTTSDVTKYDAAGKIVAAGNSNVVYTVTHTASGKTADTGIVVVTVVVE